MKPMFKDYVCKIFKVNFGEYKSIMTELRPIFGIRRQNDQN